MRLFMNGATLIPIVLTLNSCAGEPHGAGYWFHFIFVIIPLIVMGFILFRKSERISDSLFTIEGQLKKLSGKIENLEERVKKLTDKEQ